MKRLILGLGSNLGDRIANLENAIDTICNKFSLCKISSVYSTKSLLKDDQPDYYNVVCSYLSDMEPLETLNFLQNVEKVLGRVKNTGFWGARIIDIDIVDFNNTVITTPLLTVPHAMMSKRSFVLYPMMEIEPSYIHPILGISVQKMISFLNDDLDIKCIGKLSL